MTEVGEKWTLVEEWVQPPEEVYEVLLSAPRRRRDYVGGFHNWLFWACCEIKRRCPSVDARTLYLWLEKAAASYRDRGIPAREIRDAITNSAASSSAGPEDLPASHKLPRDNALIEQIERHVSLEDLPGLWAPRSLPPAVVLEKLYRPDDYLCLAPGADQYPVLRFCRWWCNLSVARLDSMSMIVPNPMFLRPGVKKSGGKSWRTLDNTGPRRYQVIEFDEGVKEDQIKRHIWLSQYAYLVLLVDSGGKSIHGWYRAHAVLSDQQNFFAQATRVGADPVMWTRCQYTRTPGAIRSGLIRQPVIYFA